MGIRHVGKVWWTISFSLSAPSLAVNRVCVYVSVCVSVCVYVCIWVGRGILEDHQISLYSDIPVLLQPKKKKNTTMGSINVYVFVCTCVPVSNIAKYTHFMSVFEAVTVYLCTHTKMCVRA